MRPSPPSLSKARVSDFKAPCPPLPCSLSLLLLLAPRSWGLCVQHSSDSALCVRGTGTACGIPGGSQLTQPGKPHSSSGHDRHAAQRLRLLSLTHQPPACPGPRKAPQPLSFTSAVIFKLLLETGSQRAWGLSSCLHLSSTGWDHHRF